MHGRTRPQVAVCPPRHYRQRRRTERAIAAYAAVAGALATPAAAVPDTA